MELFLPNFICARLASLRNDPFFANYYIESTKPHTAYQNILKGLHLSHGMSDFSY